MGTYKGVNPYATYSKKKEEPKFKVGDKVRILNKTRGETLDYTYSDGHKWKKGDIAYIYRVFLESYALTPYENHEISTDRRYGYGTFNSSDIKKIKEPKFKVGDEVIILSKSIGTSKYNINTKQTRIIEHVRIYPNGWRADTKFPTPKKGEFYYVIDAWNFSERDLKLVEEKEMKYKAGNKTLVVEPLKGQMTKGNLPSIAENNSFLTTMIRDFNYSYGDGIPIDSKFIKYVEQHPCFIEWLLINNFIEEKIKPFEPFNITLKIDRVEEYWDLWHRLNIPLDRVDGYLEQKQLKPSDLTNRDELWRTVDRQKEKVKGHHSKNENI